MIEMSKFTTLIQLTEFLGGIQNFVTVVSKWFFDIKYPFLIPLDRDNLEYCFTNGNETKRMNVYKVALK